MSKEKYYYAKVKCSNCDYGYPHDDNHKIPKGMTFKQYSKTTECPNCGCKSVLYYYDQGIKEN